MSRYKVIRIIDSGNPYSDCICRDTESGKEVTIDMLVDGAFPEGTTSESLVGKTIVVDYLLPCTFIAMSPAIVEAV